MLDFSAFEKSENGLDQLEARFGNDRFVFLAENAWEEIETWVLAGLELPGKWRWADVRAE